MNKEPKTIEQLARDAGWIETTIKECRKGDQVLLPDKGFFGTASDGLPQVCKYPHCIENSDGETWGVGGDDRVLRAPRPESRYKPGTVVWGKDKYLTSPQMFIRRRDENRPWAGVADCDDEPDSWPHGSIEVLRVLAYPDGTTPESGPVTDEQVLAAVNTYRGQLKLEPVWSVKDLNPKTVERRRAILEAARLTPVKANDTAEPINNAAEPITDEQVLAAINAKRGHFGYEHEDSLDEFLPESVKAWRSALEAARLTPVKAEDAAKPITLETIRETGKVAVDEEGDRWHWSEEGNEFHYWTTEADATGIPVRTCTLLDATTPGYFTHWADEEAGE